MLYDLHFSPFNLDNIAYSGICTAPLDSKMEEDALTYEPINDNEQANSLVKCLGAALLWHDIVRK